MSTSPLTHPTYHDIRVRDRNVKKGLVDPKDIEKHLKELPDNADKLETLHVPQPALGNRGND